MALGFTSHFAKQEQPFGTLLISGTESETAGSVACGDYSQSVLYSCALYDSCEFSVSVDIDYSQYANCVASSSGSAETAGSVAYSGDGGGVSMASFSGGGCSVSCCTSSATYTC